MAEIAKDNAAAATPQFAKAQLLASARYADRKDLLSAVLEDGKCYSHTEVEQRMKKFLERKVR